MDIKKRIAETIKDVVTELPVDKTRKEKFLDSCKNYPNLREGFLTADELIRRKNEIYEIVEMAEAIIMEQGDEWFDKVTISRDMKNLKEAYKVLEKSCNEMVQLNQRFNVAFDDIGQKLSRYYPVGGIMKPTIQTESVNSDKKGSLFDRIKPQERWWENDPEDLMAYLYWLKRSLPPVDPRKKKREWLKIMDQLAAKHKAPYKDFSRLAKHTFESVEEQIIDSVNGVIAHGDDLDVGHQDDEPGMLKSTSYEIATYAARLYKKLSKYDQLDGEVDFPNWWQSKLILAKDYVSKAYHYLDSEEKQPIIDKLALEHTLSEATGEFVVYVEKDNGRKKLLHTKKSQRAANMFMSKNMDKILNTSGIRSIGSMSKDEWEKKEAQFAENIKKTGMKTVTKKEWDRTHKDHKGVIKGKPYMMWFDKKTQSTVYGPVNIEESVNGGIWPKSKLSDRFEFILSDELKKNFKGIFYVVGYDLYHNDKKVMTINSDKDSVNSIVKTLKSKLKESVNEATSKNIVKDLDKVKNDLLKQVAVLIAKKKELYSNMDIESPMSSAEKKLNKDISDLWSEINKLIRQKRSIKESVNEGSIKKSFKVKMYGPKMRTKGSDDVVQMIAKKLKIDRGNSAEDSDKFDEIERQVERQYDANKREINFKINLKESVNEGTDKIQQFDDVHIKSKNLTGTVYSIKGNDVVVNTLKKGLVKAKMDDLTKLFTDGVNEAYDKRAYDSFIKYLQKNAASANLELFDPIPVGGSIFNKEYENADNVLSFDWNILDGKYTGSVKQKINNFFKKAAAKFNMKPIHIQVGSVEFAPASDKIDEARSIGVVQREWGKTVDKMKSIVADWKGAEGSQKDALTKKLKDLTKKKKELEQELNDAVMSKGIDQSLSAVDEAANDYQVYHNQYSSAIDEVEKYAKLRGYDLDQEEYGSAYDNAFFKPKEGSTKRDTLALYKNGKEQKKALHIQIYGRGDNKYELNMYIN